MSEQKCCTINPDVFVSVLQIKSYHALLVFSSWIASSLQRFGEVPFGSLVPPEADRNTAAHTLYKLLGEEMKRSPNTPLLFQFFIL